MCSFMNDEFDIALVMAGLSLVRFLMCLCYCRSLAFLERIYCTPLDQGP